jgi:anthranilate synthase
MFNTHCYTTKGGVCISRSITETVIETAINEVLSRIDSQRGGLFSSSYEYPGRYKRWAIGFVNPPLELVTTDNFFTLTAHNDRGVVLLQYLAERLFGREQLQIVNWETKHLSGLIRPTEHLFSEEERSKQPSVFNIVRAVWCIWLRFGFPI